MDLDAYLNVTMKEHQDNWVSPHVTTTYAIIGKQ